jgi:uncharacterized coiled-coil DUF342 family protein
MEKVSELFEVDVEAFIGNLQAMKSYIDDIINKVQTRHLILYDLLENLESLTNKACILETIISLIKRKAQRFRPNNINLHQALADIEKSIRSLKADILVMIRAYQKDPNFAINNAYNDLLDISSRANMIRLRMDAFIKDGLFI